MDLAVYLLTAVITVFAIIALVALWFSVASGQWRNLDAASRVVLDIDDPLPSDEKGAC